MTVKERLQKVVSQMNEEEAVDVLALVEGARAGATPTDLYGTAWGEIFADVGPDAVAITGKPTIQIPRGTPDVG